MNVPSFIAWRIAFDGKKSFSRFIIRLSVAATVISVAVMIVTLAFVNGFQETVSGKVFSFWGHVRIQYRQPMKAAIAEEVPIEQNDTVVQAVKNQNGVSHIQPFATKYAILKTADEMEGVLLKGIDSAYNVHYLSGFLQKGRWLQFNDTTYSREIVVSAFTAKQLHLDTGGRILIYFVRPDGSLRPDKLTVAGIYKTGIEEYDKTFAIGDLKLIQKLNGWGEREIGGYEIFLHNYNTMDDVSYAIYNNESFPLLWETKTTREIYPNIFDWLQIQNTNRNILIAIMIIIAGINLITCLIILVLERLRMIGLLKAFGASDWTVQKVFLYQSAFITLTGILLGTLVALALVWLQQKTGFIRLDETAYYMDVAAVKIVWWQVWAVAIGTLIISVLVLLIPSLLVRKIQPIKAVRFS